ncbi:hypothetical protein O3G_MSEX009934 [Manduca sexta]|uniref:Uncharacterized protein n=1 Tax=Manduca sexta TaxID=7130 RepID=A0A921ZF21_MANSE|nr:hypothetical protein O3G_MSEX009934 [Manduca sexta]
MDRKREKAELMSGRLYTSNLTGTCKTHSFAAESFNIAPMLLCENQQVRTRSWRSGGLLETLRRQIKKPYLVHGFSHFSSSIFVLSSSVATQQGCRQCYFQF